MKVHVPLHLTARWLSEDVARTEHKRINGKPAPKSKYMKPKSISIRQYIARAEKLKQL